MPCLFEREFHGHNSATLLRTVTPGCEWVLAGEGVATRKFDGTACAIIGGALYKRYDAKRGKAAPAGAIPCDEPDPVTGHHPHWIAVGEEPESRWHREAYPATGATLPDGTIETSAPCLLDGTYELCGPKLQGNPEQIKSHVLIPHGQHVLDAPRDWDGLRTYFETNRMEGIVWHHPDGRMCKLRRADYGLPWPPEKPR